MGSPYTYESPTALNFFFFFGQKSSKNYNGKSNESNTQKKKKQSIRARNRTQFSKEQDSKYTKIGKD